MLIKTKKSIAMWLFLVAAPIGVWLLLPDAPPAATPAKAIPVQVQVAATAPVALTTPQQAEFEKYVELGGAMGAYPASLDGTQVDGHVAVDANGHLIVDLGLRQIFDYFLATIGEETLEQIRARIAFYLQQQLPADAALQAWDILTQYLAYKDALADLSGHDGSYEGMRDSLQRQRELRDSLLSPALSTAFFQEEDTYADFALEHIENLRNPELSAAEKQAQTQALLETLPAPTRELIQATGAPLGVEQQVQVLREQGGSDSDIWQFREQQFGAAAADRLAALDAQRLQWEQRYEQYRQQRAVIENSGLAEQDIQQEIERLRAEQFADSERKRVAALDRIAEATRTAP